MQLEAGEGHKSASQSASQSVSQPDSPVGPIAVSRLASKVLWQVDDVDSLERTFLHTDTAANAKLFTNVSDLQQEGHEHIFMASQPAKPLSGFLTLELGATSIHCLPILTTGHIFLHS